MRLERKWTIDISLQFRSRSVVALRIELSAPWLSAEDGQALDYQRAQWAGRRSNPRLRLFRPLLDRLSYQPKLSLPTKKARCRCDTGLESSVRALGVNSAADAWAVHSPADRRCYLGIVFRLSNSTTETT
jgi:hypothetical protein